MALSKAIFARFRAIESQLAANAMDVMIPRVARESCTGSFDTYEDVMAALLKASLPMVTLQLLLDLMDAIRGGVGGPSTLSMACRANDAELVSLLLPCAGIDVNKADTSGKTPLYIAIMFGHYAIAKLLLDQDKINPNIPTNEGDTPLIMACRINAEQSVERLLGHDDIDVNKGPGGITPLMIAIERSLIVTDAKKSVVKMLLKHPNIEVNTAVANADYGITPLSIACRANGEELVNLLLENCKDIDVNKADDSGKTPLYVAAENDCEDVVRLLLTQDDIETEKAVTAGEDKGKTPLMIAQEKDYMNIAHRISRHPAMVACKARNWEEVRRLTGESPLLFAIEYMLPPTLDVLLGISEGGVNEAAPLVFQGAGHPFLGVQIPGTTPLTMACAQNDGEPHVKRLLQCEHIEVNKADTSGKTPLYIAIMYCNYAIAKLLLEQDKINPNIATNEGDTPLSMACQYLNDADSVRLLLQCKDIDVNKGPRATTPLMLAIAQLPDEGLVGISPKKCIVKMLLDHPNIEVNKAVGHGITALIMACQMNDYYLVELLLKCKGIDVNKAHESGKTPLFVACEFGALKIVIVLLGVKGILFEKAVTSDTDTVGPDEGKTPLNIACEKFNAYGLDDDLKIIMALRAHRQELSVNERPEAARPAVAAGGANILVDRGVEDAQQKAAADAYKLRTHDRQQMLMRRATGASGVGGGGASAGGGGGDRRSNSKKKKKKK